MKEINKELKVALDAAKMAGEFVISSQNNFKIQKMKQGILDFATDADYKSEKIIIDIIKKQFPNDFILAEESSTKMQDVDRVWIIDPIDGTRNFAHGLPHFCVSIAFYSEKIKHGVVFAPKLNELFYASIGKGAFFNDKKLIMRNPNYRLGESLVATGFSGKYQHKMDYLLGKVKKVACACTDTMRLGAGALDTCYVASGRLGASFEYNLKPWDIAAALVILEEAGAIYSDFNGKKLDIYREVDCELSINFLASKNKTIHKEMLELIKD